MAHLIQQEMWSTKDTHLLMQKQALPTHASYSTGAELLIDKGKIESEICVNIMLGVTQLKEGIKVIETKKSSLSKEDWDSDSDETYKEYLDNFLNYMNEVSGFFEALSQKNINDAEVFEELDSYDLGLVNTLSKNYTDFPSSDLSTQLEDNVRGIKLALNEAEE